MLNKSVNLVQILGRKGLLTLFLLSFAINLKAQLNSEIGYSGAYMPAIYSNKIIKRYNSGNQMLSNMKQMHYAGGFHIGATYRIGNVKFGAAWEGLTAKRTGVQGDLTANIASEKKIFFYFNSFSGSMEFAYSHFGIGGTIDKNNFKLKTIVSGTTSKINVLDNEYYSSKFYLSFYIRGTDKLGISLKPFVRVPWSNVSVTKMAEYLKVPENSIFQNEKLIQFGLTIVLLNGLQPEK